MAKDNSKKPSISYNAPNGNAPVGSSTNTNEVPSQKFVGPAWDDKAPAVLKGKTDTTQQEATEQENTQQFDSQPNYQGGYQGPPPNYQAGYQAPPPGYAATGAYYPYQKKSGTWWKVLLIIAGVLLIIGVIIYQINSFFSSLFYVGDEPDYDIPDTKYIAELSVEGEITSASDDSYFSDGTTYNHQFTLDVLDEITNDDNNVGLLLFVDTPGGGVYETDQLYLKIKKYQEKTERPVYVAMGNMAASGGYYISAPADKIYADRNTWTGSLGVIMSTQYDITEFLNKLGIKAETLTAGKNKAMGSITEPMTDEQREIFQSLIDDSYNQFVGIIAEGRGMDIETVKTLADGRIYTANQAVANGLIDGIATKEEAAAMLQKDYKLENYEITPIEYTYDDSAWMTEFIKSAVKPALNQLKSIGKSDLDTVLELTEESSNVPLKYMYEQ